MLGNPNGHIDVAARSLQTIVECATDDQLFNAFFLVDSPLQAGFCRYLVTRYIQCVVKESGPDLHNTITQWSAILSKPSLYPPNTKEPIHRVRSQDDQVEVEIDVDYDSIPMISSQKRGSDSLEIPDLPGGDNETKSGSPPSPAHKPAQLKPKLSSDFETKEREVGPAASSSTARGGGLVLSLDDMSDNTLSNMVNFVLDDDLGDEVKVGERPRLVSMMSEESFVLDALVASNETPETDAARERRELAALSEEQLALRRDETAMLVDIMYELPPEELRDALHHKLRVCCCRFNMTTVSKVEVDAIRKKTRILDDVLSFFVKSTGEDDDGTTETSRRKRDKRKSSDNSVSWYSSDTLAECLDMIEYHIFRPLPASRNGPESEHRRNAPVTNVSINEEEADGFEDLEWPHLELVYKILLFMVSANAQIEKRHLGKVLKERFIRQFMELFLTEDRRERECLKTILHRIYGRFMGIRKTVRIIMSWHCHSVVYGNRRNCFGISEFLQIIVSVIHGYATPVKEEHKDFLRNVLIPLHKSPCLISSHEEVAACMYQFVFKEPNVAMVIFGGLLKFWPNGATMKQEILLTEIKNIIAILIANEKRFDWDEAAQILERVVDHLASCMTSTHHMVAQRAISLWVDESMQLFADRNRHIVWRKIASSLVENETHWSPDVREATQELVQYMQAKDPTEWVIVHEEARGDWEAKTPVSPPRQFHTQTTERGRQKNRMWSELINVASNPAAAGRHRARSRTKSRTRSERATSPPKNVRRSSREREHSSSRPINHRQSSGGLRSRAGSSGPPRTDSNPRLSGNGNTPTSASSNSSSGSPPNRSKGRQRSSSGRRGLGFGRRRQQSQTSPNEESRTPKRGIWR